MATPMAINPRNAGAFADRSNSQAGTVSFGVVDEPGTLPPEVVVDLAQRATACGMLHPLCDDRARP
jgi:hypothetical protein